MSFLDKVGKVAMDAVDGAARLAEKARERVDPLLEKAPLPAGLRDRLRPKADDFRAPDPEPNESPFQTAPEPEQRKPLANAAVPAQVYGRGTDPWTGRALQLLADRGVEHEFVDLEVEGGAQIEGQLIRETRQNDSPYVYLRGEFVGGFNALDEIDRLGQLDDRVKPAEERSKAVGRVRIAIPKHGEDLFPGEHGNPDDRK
jgi:glutaredoxin